MSVSANLKKLRNKKGINQEELSAMLGVNRSLIAQYERGTKIPNLLTAKEIAKILGCTLDDFLEED